MSSASNKTLIGLFVLVAAALLVAALAVFGSGKFFTKQYQCVMYFNGSVSGLTLGAPVLFRGVPIGTVKDIDIKTDPENLKFTIPVLVEIHEGQTSVKGVGVNTLLSARKQTPEELLKALVAQGLRAQLVTQSFVTGQLAIALDLRPDTPANFQGDGSFPEIPTIPSEFEEVAQTLKNLPLQELATRLVGAVGAVENLLKSPQTIKIPENTNLVLASATQLMADLKTRVNSLSTNLDQAAQSYNTLAVNLDQRTDKLSASLRKSLDSLDPAVAEGKAALIKFQRIVNPESPSITELNKALNEISQAAKSIRTLADYLERHPEALIQGKGDRR